MGYDAQTWDPILTDIATRNNVDPKLLTSIARQENVASGDYNPLGISPGDGGPTHTGSVEAGAAYAESYIQKHLERFQAVDLKDPSSVRNFSAWYSPPGAVNDPYRTNDTEASGILTAAGEPSAFSLRSGYQQREVTPYLEPSAQPAGSGAAPQTQAGWGETPLFDDFRIKHAKEFKDKSDEEVLSSLNKTFAPEIDPDRFRKIAHSTHWREELIADLSKQVAPITLLRRFDRRFKNLTQSDEEIIHSLYNARKEQGSIPKEMDEADFREIYKPSPGISHWMYAQEAAATGAFFMPNLALAQAAYTTGNFIFGLGNSIRSDQKGEQPATTGKVGAVRVDVGPALLASERHAQDVVDAYQHSPDWFRGLTKFVGDHWNAVGPRLEQRMKEASYMQQYGARYGGPVPAGQITGGFIGQLPMMSRIWFTKSLPLAQRMILASGIEAVSGMGERTKVKQEATLKQSVKDGLVSAGSIFLLNNPYGRLTMGLWNSLLGAGDQALQDWIDGKPSPVTDYLKSAVVNFGVGWWQGRKGKEGLKFEIPAVEWPDVVPIRTSPVGGAEGEVTKLLTGRAPAKLLPYTPPFARTRFQYREPIRMPGPSGFVPAAEGAPTIPMVMPEEKPNWAAINEAMGLARAARDKGHYRKAAGYLDTAGALMPESVRQDFAETLINLSNGKIDKTLLNSFVDEYFGLGEGPAIKPPPEEPPELRGVPL